MGSLIEFSNIHKSFGSIHVLKNLNLTVKEGDLIGLIGKSGEGKSTLLRVLIGFYKIDKGSIHFKSQDVTRKTHLIRNIVGFCTQENSFYPELTIEENLWYFGKLYGITRRVLKQRIPHLLKLVDLTHSKNKLAGNISGGMKRRVDFAIALIHDPKLLILDEPTTGLDPVIRQSLWDLIEQINTEGVTIIVSSHLLDFIEDKCSSIAVLKRGIVEVHSMNGLRKKYSSKKSLTQLFTKVIE